MNIALINKKTNICENIAVFADMKTAQDMLGKEYILTEQVVGYGIGDTYKDGVWSKQEEPQPTASQLREHAYETLTHKEDNTPLLEWEGQAITVNTAAAKWTYYSSEGSSIANELSGLIVAAKAYIREMYPQE